MRVFILLLSMLWLQAHGGGLLRPPAPAPAATRPAVAAQVTAPAPLTTPLPADPAVTAGRLPNGLRYYVRANKQPMGRAELRLAVNAGSVLEDDDQRGLAHFVEHMAFNGTKHFPEAGHRHVHRVDRHAVRADVNAYTTFDETVYSCRCRPTSPTILDRALLDPRRLGAERHVRSGRGRQGARRRHRGVAAGARRRRAACTTSSFRCCSRDRATRSALPIGTHRDHPEVRAARLKRFYRTGTART